MASDVNYFIYSLFGVYIGAYSSLAVIRDPALIIDMVGYPPALFRARRSYGTRRSFGPLWHIMQIYVS